MVKFHAWGGAVDVPAALGVEASWSLVPWTPKPAVLGCIYGENLKFTHVFPVSLTPKHSS